tara:strand:+ start:5627 stop:6616 length:990 start_codon:yes stop_codon:yes gene_type:complete
MKKSLILLSFLIILLSSCNDIRKTSLSGLIYGTTYNIQFYSSYSENYFFEIDSIFNEIDDSMSTYKSNSLITKINTNQTVLLDNHFKNVFNTSKKIFNATDGRFDPSVGLLVNYWGFGPDTAGTSRLKKTQNQFLELLNKVGFDKFYINDDILIRPKNSYIDFNAIAKGYAVDQIGLFLKSKNINNFLIEIGGEINASGINISKNKNWLVAIDMPRFDGNRSIYDKLELTNISLASSGTYRKFKIDSSGNRYAHIIDPYTGYPSKTNILSVTVKASSCIEADAYATAIHTMDIENIKQFFEKTPDISSLIIFENNKRELEELILNNFYK